MAPPSPPDLAPLAEAYDAPTGTLDPSVAAGVVAFVAQNAPVIEPVFHLVADALATVRERLEGGDEPLPITGVQAGELSIDAVVDVRRVCAGWDPAATEPSPEADGTLDVTALLTDNQLHRTVWGTVTRCRERLAIAGGTPVALFVDGAVEVLLYDGIPLAARDVHLLVRLDGVLGLGGERAAPKVLDFRVRYPRFDVRVEVPDGHVIASFGLDGLIVTARNGRFTCAPETATCEAAELMP